VDSIEREARLRAAAEFREQGDATTAEMLEAMVDPEVLWDLVVREVRGSVSPLDLETYLIPSRGLHLEDTLLTVSVPNEDAQHWILKTFGDQIRPILAKLG
jgi:hypothetical protein